MITAFLFFWFFSASADVTIDADTISLGDLIALLPGDPRASITFGSAPNPGLARRISKQEILNKLALAGKPTSDLMLPDSILVRRQSAGLDHDQVSRAILDALAKRFPGASIEITNMQIPPLQIGTGPVEITAILPARFDPASPVFVRVDVRGTSFAKTAFVRSDVQIETSQPVLKNRVPAHTEIRPNDIEWKMTPVQVSAAPETIQGMLAKRDLEPGQILTGDLLYMPLFVHKGDSVTVKASAGSVTIAATMRAKEAGRLGETITVEHLTGEGSTAARIVGLRILEVSK